MATSNQTKLKMMTEHPLTSEIINASKWGYEHCLSIYTDEDLRKAADWQLEQVNDFFDNYRKTVMEVKPGHIPSLTELLSLMNQAMRPTTTQEEADAYQKLQRTAIRSRCSRSS